MKFTKRILLALSTGYILYFYSERVFWSLARPGDTFFDYLLTPLIYGIFAYIFLIIVEMFRVRNIWAIFIAGAAFGWINEGIFAMTLFGAEIPFPFTISWTGLASHALISVCIGWYYLCKLLEENSSKNVFYVSVLLGVFWGVWSIAWALETPPILASIPAYLIHGLAATLLLVGSHWLFTKADPAGFHAGKKERIVLAILVLLFYGAVTVPTIGWVALVVLPVLFLLLFVILRKNKAQQSMGSVLTELGKPMRWRNALILFIMPVTATIIYAIANAAHLIYRTNLYFMIVTTALGFIMFAVSAIQIFRRS